MLEHSAPKAARQAEILRTAVIRVTSQLGLTQAELGQILGMSAATVSRLVHGSFVLRPDSKEGELALLFLRIVRSLDSLLGGDAEKSRRWLRAHNHHLGGIPLERMKSVVGLVDVAGYLDAMRGHA